MAALFVFDRRDRRAIRKERVFRDRTHPLEIYDDDEVVGRFRFDRQFIFELADDLREDLEFHVPRKGSLPPVLQVCVALRFYATGTFQNVVSDLIGVSQPTASRVIKRVTDALWRRSRRWIQMPQQEEADEQKRKFYAMRGFPNVFACIDCTHVPIQAPWEREFEFVNRKNGHSVNVQVVCDADLRVINIVSRWPGSVHDARILRNSPLFEAFESNEPPLDGLILGDSGYMVRPWLLTPLLRPRTAADRRYNFAHRSTRCTVERTIGIAKQRFQCLRNCLRFQPKIANRVIMVCFMLHNRARHLNLPLPENEDGFEDRDDNREVDGDQGQVGDINERARTAVGNRVREMVIRNNFMHQNIPAAER